LLLSGDFACVKAALAMLASAIHRAMKSRPSRLGEGGENFALRLITSANVYHLSDQIRVDQT